MELIPGSETSTHLIQTPGLHPKEYTVHQQHGESLKTKTVHFVLAINISSSLQCDKKDGAKFNYNSHMQIANCTLLLVC
jgi:hypothetical protein